MPGVVPDYLAGEPCTARICWAAVVIVLLFSSVSAAARKMARRTQNSSDRVHECQAGCLYEGPPQSRHFPEQKDVLYSEESDAVLTAMARCYYRNAVVSVRPDKYRAEEDLAKESMCVRGGDIPT